MKIAREMKAKAIAMGFDDIAIEHRNGHFRLQAMIRGRPVKMHFACTPSDKYAERKRVADLRRLARTGP
jgi:hypothetical protein